MPALRSLIIGDRASAWTAAGFEVDQRHGRARTRIGEIEIELVGPDDGRGIIGWRFDVGGLPSDIDGITTLQAPSSEEDGEPPPHPNGIDHIDHVVMFTPDLARTTGALAAAGFEERRRRDVPDAEPPKQQVFYWAGSTIIELVGPLAATGTGPASLWGLALSAADLDATAATLGDRLGRPKGAVQTGRRIATLRTRDLDISTAIAVMSPHVSDPDA